MRTLITAVAAACGFAALALAQPTTAPGLEPGEAQSRQTSTRPATTQFTHPPVETRGVWLPSRDILVPIDQLMAKLDQLKAAGFTRVMIDVQFRGGVLYPGSAYLPQVPEAHGEDLLRALINEIHKRGMKADAWMEYGFYAHFTDKPNDTSKGKWIDADPSIMSVDANGNGAITRSFGTFYSLDPANPKAVQLLAGLDAEVASRYDIDALNLDRIRFAAWDHLSLASRERFEKETGLKWAAFDKNSEEGHKLSEWKRQQNLEACRTIVNAIRKAKPGLQITAYVVPPDEKDDKSQAWDLWMQNNLLDQLSVSMYGADITADAHKAITLLGGDTHRLIAAIDSNHPTPQYLTNIETSRELGMIGQFTWYSGTIDDADVQGLRSGPYAQPAKDPIGAWEPHK